MNTEIGLSDTMRRLLVPIALLAGAAPAAADPDPGLYAVDWRLSLPHVRTDARGTAEVCLTGPGLAGLTPLSPNNPLSGCPVETVGKDGTEVLIRIVCPGGGAALAEGVYRTAPDRFSGWFEMKMGGKNMTMNEAQDGRRIGDCP